jgi:hypothetical protein
MAEAGPSNGQAAAPAADAGNKHPSGIVPTLQNVVATVNLGCQLDLKQIAMQARNAEYNPKVSPDWLGPFCWVWLRWEQGVGCASIGRVKNWQRLGTLLYPQPAVAACVENFQAHSV